MVAAGRWEGDSEMSVAEGPKGLDRAGVQPGPRARADGKQSTTRGQGDPKNWRLRRFRKRKPCTCEVRLWGKQGEAQTASRSLLVGSRHGGEMEGRRPWSPQGLLVPGHQGEFCACASLSSQTPVPKVPSGRPFPESGDSCRL